MALIRGVRGIKTEHQQRVLMIGNFDGVHLGHQSIISGVLKEYDISEQPSTMVMLFEPHPVTYFANGRKQRLTQLGEKVRLLHQYGIDDVLVMRFNASLAEQTAQEFVENLLIKQLAVKHVVIGHDFRFGKDRKGDVTLLQNYVDSGCFRLSCLPAFTAEGERVSSTWIRGLIKAGEVAQANALMGHSFEMSARVQSGDKRGRELGYPTANLYIQQSDKQLAYGIYVVTAEVEGQSYPAVASLGVRPAVINDGPVVLEVHCLDIPWTDFYGKKFRVLFHHKLRQEENFDSLQALVKQMSQDCDEARQYFQENDRLLK